MNFNDIVFQCVFWSVLCAYKWQHMFVIKHGRLLYQSRHLYEEKRSFLHLKVKEIFNFAWNFYKFHQVRRPYYSRKKLSISFGTLDRGCADLSKLDRFSELGKPADYVCGGEENRAEFDIRSVKRLNFWKVRRRFTLLPFSLNCLIFCDAVTMQFAAGNGSTLRRRVQLPFKRTGKEYRAHV